MTIKHFGRLGIPLHAPVVDRRVRHQSYGVHRYPLPEQNLLCRGVSLHLTLHLYVEDLQCFGSCEDARQNTEVRQTALIYNVVITNLFMLMINGMFNCHKADIFSINI